MKIARGDSVVILAGKDKGKKGTVLRVFPADQRVLVAGVNLVTKYIKKTTQNAGRMLKVEHTLHVSNVAIVDPKTGKPTRIGYRRDSEKGTVVRIAKKSGAVLERVKVAPQDTEKAASAAAPGEAAPKKSPFWRRGKSASASGDASSKTEEGPATATVTHARSAGRGS